jgi:TolB-like protein/Tfp pilus assembly protein PilF
MAVFSLKDFLNEARRRRVFGVMAFYVAGAFVLIQVADLAFPGFGIPDFAIRYVWIGAILGLPVALVFGWRYDMTIQGIRRTPTDLEEPIDHELHTPDIILLLALSLATLTMIFLLAEKIVQTQGMIEPVDSVAELPEFDPPEHSIAVLPFDNLSSDPEQEYFVDGMHDALIAELARISGLTVISRTSTLGYKATILTVSKIARELNVAMIVEGSVLKAGDDIRIQVQLIGVQPERHLLAKTYDRQLSSVLKLQSEVTQDIAEEIEVKLTPQEQSRNSKVGDVDPEAYTLWLKGNFHLTRMDEESFRKALALYQQAIDRDPDYAPAYAGQAAAYANLGGWFASESPHDVRRLAKKAAERALVLDPTSGEAHLALGLIRYQFDWDWEGAERAFKQGIAANPASTAGRIDYANFLTSMGRYDESIEIGRQTLARDPLAPAAYNELAWPLYKLGRDDEALEVIQKGLELDPDFSQTHFALSNHFMMLGDFEKGLENMSKFAIVEPTTPPSVVRIFGLFYGLAGRQSEARALLSQLLERRASSYVPAQAIADIYLGLGEYDDALNWMELAYEEQDVELVLINQYWPYDPLRSDPRFQSILERMDFPKP